MADTDHKSGHEERDVHVGPIVILGIVLLAGTALSLLLMDWTFDYLNAQEDRAQREPASLLRAENPPPPPRPAFQMYPAAELREVKAAEKAHLASYGWVDRENGVALIPVERAMEIVAEGGLPELAALNPEANDDETAPPAPATDAGGESPDENIPGDAGS
jgi:hypothetical protein